MTRAKSIGTLAASTLAVLSAFTFAHAQEAKKVPLSTAEHFYVTEGLFDLKYGKSIDLTDRNILFSFPANINHPDRLPADLRLKVNGKDWKMTPGTRVDLKYEDATKKFVNDMSTCFIDLLDISIPKGSPPVAHFRFVCH